VPMHTEQLLSRLTGQSLADIESTDGPAGVALAEAMVLEELSSVARCCVSTIGSAKGAAARGDCWRHLFGGVTIWLGEPTHLHVATRHARLGHREGELNSPHLLADERSDAEAPQREAYGLAEVTVCTMHASASRRTQPLQRLTRPLGQVDASALDALSGSELAERTLPALDKLLSVEKDLVGKKSLYVRLGSRGDWYVFLD